MSQKTKKTFHKRPQHEEETETTLYEGRNEVMELLRAGRTVDKLFVAPDQNGRMADIVAMAKAAGAVVTQVDRRKLDAMSETGVHQGVIAQAAAHEYVSLEDILQTAADRGEQPLIMICDGLTDPHNLGAIIRTAGAAGAHGVVIPKHRSVGLTATVAKASAGAINYTPVAKVTNLSQTIETLKQEGMWFVCADMGGSTMYDLNLTGPIGLVMGNEGSGVSDLVKKHCDFVASIPMKGDIDSLNVSVATGVLTYEIVRQRLLKK